jgi:hypothetical protein
MNKEEIKKELSILLNPTKIMPKMYSFHEVRDLISSAITRTVEEIEEKVNYEFDEDDDAIKMVSKIHRILNSTNRKIK